MKKTWRQCTKLYCRDGINWDSFTCI